MTLSTPSTAYASAKLQGTGVGRGLALGPVLRMPDPLPEPEDVASTRSAVQEEERAVSSLSATAATIRHRGERAGGSAKDVLEAQALMAEDPTLVDDVNARIDARQDRRARRLRGVRAFQRPARRHGRLHGRARDRPRRRRRSGSSRTCAACPPPACPESDKPFVLVARDLAPADTALLDLDKVLGLITRDGGPTSHTAILARAKSITGDRRRDRRADARRRRSA